MQGNTQSDIVERISRMHRHDVIAYLGRLECTFPLDLTPKFLAAMSLGRLRHVAFAASLHARNAVEALDLFAPAH